MTWADRVVAKREDGLGSQTQTTRDRSPMIDRSAAVDANDDFRSTRKAQSSRSGQRQTFYLYDPLSLPTTRVRKPEGIGTGGTPPKPEASHGADSSHTPTPTRIISQVDLIGPPCGKEEKADPTRPNRLSLKITHNMHLEEASIVTEKRMPSPPEHRVDHDDHIAKRPRALDLQTIVLCTPCEALPTCTASPFRKIVTVPHTMPTTTQLEPTTYPMSWANIVFAGSEAASRTDVASLLQEAAASARNDFDEESAIKWANGYTFPDRYIESDRACLRAAQLDFVS